jgi:putative ABC transport system permease protein
MRTADLLRLAFAALWRHKVRTLLTLSGVVAGTFLLVVSISIGRGVEEATINQLRKSDQLRKITVFPNYQPIEKAIPAADLEVTGLMSEERRQRLRRSLIRHWPRRGLGPVPTKILDEKQLDVLRDLAHVESVVPSLQFSCHIRWNDRSADVLASAPVAEDDKLPDRVVAGESLPASGYQVLVHEYLLYLWGITRDEDVEGMIGQKVTVEYRTRSPITNPTLGVLAGTGPMLTPMERDLLDRALMRLGSQVEELKLSEAEKNILKKVLMGADMTPRHPMEAVVFAEEFTIAGVLREWDEKDKGSTFFIRDWLLRDAELFLPVKTAADLMSRDPRHSKVGYPQAVVTVDNEDHLKEVTESVNELGFRSYSLAEFFLRVRKNILLVSFCTAFLAAMALVVASVGITNMMLMSVMERTHEIGLMKAVGARDRHILLLFLSEGVVLGVVGGAVGLLLGWLVSFPGDQIARSIVQKELQTTLEHSVFVYPFWLLAGVPLFALLVTTLSSVYPARRAARINPIQALREE